MSGGALSPSLPSPLFPGVPRLCGPRASQAREGAVAAAPPPAAPSRGCFPETNAPLRRPAPTSSTGPLADGLPLVVAGRDPKAAGEGRELWGPRTAGCAGDVAPSWDDRGRWCQGCLRGGLPRAHPYLPPVSPAQGRPVEGVGRGAVGARGRARAVGLSWAAAQVYPVVPATAASENLCPQACHVSWLLSQAPHVPGEPTSTKTSAGRPVTQPAQPSG